MVNSIKFLCLFTFILLTSKSFSQSYSYKYIDNNPYNINNLNIGINTGFDFGIRDVPAGIQVNYMIGRFSFEARFFKGISGSILKEDSFSIRGQKPAGMTELLAAIHLKDKVRKETYKYVLSVAHGYNTTTTKYLPVPVYVRKIIALRGGLLRYSVPIETGDKTYTNYYNAHTTSIVGGFLFKKVRDYKISVEDFRRKRGHRKMREAYIDFMYSPATTFSAARVFVDDKSTISVRNIGFRMGCQWRSCRVIGANFRIEAGLLPGYIIPESNLYTAMTFGLNISGRVGPKGDLIYSPSK